MERWKGRGRRGEESVRWDSHFLRQFWKSYFVFKKRFVWKFILIDIYLFCIILRIIGIRIGRMKSSKVSLENENVHGFDRIFERRGRHGLVMTLPSKSRSFRELQMVTRCSRFWNKQRTDPRRRWMIKCMRYSCAFESVDSEKKKVNAIIFRRKLFGWNTYLFLYWLENIGLYMQM